MLGFKVHKGPVRALLTSSDCLCHRLETRVPDQTSVSTTHDDVLGTLLAGPHGKSHLLMSQVPRTGVELRGPPMESSLTKNPLLSPLSTLVRTQQDYMTINSADLRQQEERAHPSQRQAEQEDWGGVGGNGGMAQQQEANPCTDYSPCPSTPRWESVSH